ncbi:MAG TPA: hypothetical protein VFA98_15420 [Thermoanaerobaculia bacterium]|nr:hypothetical protein [Thermoanaerobaculia bacterium]
MTDYAAAPAQPVLQGLITLKNPQVPAQGINFFGEGIVQSGPDAPLYVGSGHYILTLDPGLPGDVAIDPPAARFMMTVRAPIGVTTAVVTKSVAYIPSPTPRVGATKIEIILTNGAGGDEVDFEDGLEIILWRGNAGADPANVNVVSLGVGGPGTLLL